MTMTETKLTAPLVPTKTTSRFRGMSNLTRKEFGQWWTTKLWVIQLITWVVILNGITMMIMIDGGMTAADAMTEGLSSLLMIAATAVAIGAVLTTQGSIVGERELGTAAWVMSKPVARPSFVLAKMWAHTTGFTVLAIAVPTVLFIGVERLVLDYPISVGGLAVGAAVVALSVTFYIALTLALGTMFQGRGPVAGIGIGLVLMGMFFKGMLPPFIVYFTPWLLGDVASSLALGTARDPQWYLPIAATAVFTVAFVLFACRRFRREEF